MTTEEKQGWCKPKNKVMKGQRQSKGTCPSHVDLNGTIPSF
jgi:hypothetical protein